MRFGIQHAVGDSRWTPAILAPENVVRFARTVEEVGFDALAFTDHPAPSAAWVDSGGEGVADPFVSLGFCAAVTSTVRLLTFVLVASYRNPLLCAHEVATLDALSAGRVTVGLGTGYLFSEFKALGADPGERRRVFDDTVATMRAAWSGRDVSVETPEFVARGTRVLPPVIQRPHPPLWIHGNSRFGLERAARYGDAWLGMMTHDSEVVPRTTRTVPLPTFAAVGRRIAAVRAAAEAAGRDPAGIEMALAGPWGMLDVRTALPADRYLEDLVTLRDLGVDWVVSLGCGDDPAVAEETVARFGAEVIAPFRKGFP
jgi:probable F420-dependent oxidoreductase